MAHQFIIDDRTGALYADFTGRKITSAAEVLQAERGLNPEIQVFLVNVPTDSGAITGQTLTDADLSLTVGAIAAPDKGTVKFTFSSESSSALNVETLNAGVVAAALNGLDAIQTAGGVSVDMLAPGKFLITAKSVGVISGDPGANVEGCDPPSAVEVVEMRTGDSDTASQWVLSLATTPVASIAGGSWSAATSGSYSGLKANLSLSTKQMLAAVSRGVSDFEIAINHSGQNLHRSPVKISETLDPSGAGSLAITTPNLFSLGGTDVPKGQAIALSGLAYDGTTLSRGSSDVESVFGRSGAVTATSGDYTAAQVTNALDKTGDSMSGALAMGTNKITGVGDGTDAQDAVTKTQLDTKQATIDSSARLDASLIGSNGDVSNEEYGYLDGVNDYIQSQIDAKASSYDLTTHTGDYSNPHSVTASDVSAVPLSGGVTINGTITMGDTLDLGSNYLYYGIWYGGQLSGDLDANSAKLTSLADGSASGDSVNYGQVTGELARQGINEVTSTTYTTVAGDARKIVRVNSSGDATITIPADVHEVGDVFTIFRKQSGTVTLAAGSGVTLNSVGSRLELANQYSAATVICVTKGASSEFDVVGDLKS